MVERNNFIDLFRFIASFCIILVHTNFSNINVSTVENIRISARWALPYFFIVSGYFLYKRIEHQRHIEFVEIENIIIKLVSILIIASSVYFTFDFLFISSQMIRIETILIGTYFHLWFIGSLIFGYIFIWYIYKIEKEKFLRIISLIVIILAVLSGSYGSLFSIDSSFSFFRFLLSIPFLFIGMQLARYRIGKQYYLLVVLSFAAGLYLQFIEVDFLYLNYRVSRFGHEILVGTIISSVTLFLLSSMLEIPDNRFSSWGKNYSLFIYLYHPLVLFFIEVILMRLNWFMFQELAILRPLFVFVFSLFLGVILNTYFKRIFQILTGDFRTVSKKNSSI